MPVEHQGNEVVIGVKAETGRVMGDLRELEYSFYRLTSIMGRMGLPPEIDAAIGKLQRIILALRMVHSTLMFLQLGTPYGMVLGGLTGMGALLSVTNMTTDYNMKTGE